MLQEGRTSINGHLYVIRCMNAQFLSLERLECVSPSPSNLLLHFWEDDQA